MNEYVLKPWLDLAPGERAILGGVDCVFERGAIGASDVERAPEHDGGLDARHAAQAARRSIDVLSRRLEGDQPGMVRDVFAAALHHDPTVREVDDPVAALGFIHVVGRDQDREAVARHVMNEVPELASRLGVDACGRLVEQQELRLVQDAGGKRKALFPAAGELRGKLVATVSEPHALHDATHCLACVGHLVNACHEIEILEHRQVVVEAELLRHVADLVADQWRLPDDVEPKTGAVSAVGDEEPAQYANGGSLAATIGAEKAADFTLGDLQAQPIDYLQGTEA